MSGQIGASHSAAALEQAARQAAIKGGLVLIGNFRRKQQIWAKSPFDLVTQADIDSEEVIVSEIRRRFPDHTIITEEQGKLAGDTDCVWIVDPLDGTLKFVLGEPYFSVSIAYEFRGVVEVACVHNPYTGETFSACRGQGAFKDGMALHTSTIPHLSTSFVCCDWGGSPQMQQQGLCYLSRLLPPATRGVGVNFSPALDLCNLAEGQIAAMISNGTTPEDHAAGALIVQEAGGHVTNFGQTGWSPHRRGIVATSTSDIAGQVAQMLHGSAGQGPASVNETNSCERW